MKLMHQPFPTQFLRPHETYKQCARLSPLRQTQSPRAPLPSLETTEIIDDLVEPADAGMQPRRSLAIFKDTAWERGTIAVIPTLSLGTKRMRGKRSNPQ